MDNVISNFQASAGSSYGAIKIRWDIPYNFYLGGWTWFHPDLADYFALDETVMPPSVDMGSPIQDGWIFDGQGYFVYGQVSNCPYFNQNALENGAYHDDIAYYGIDENLLGYGNPAWTGTGPSGGISGDPFYSSYELHDVAPIFFLPSNFFSGYNVSYQPGWHVDDYSTGGGIMQFSPNMNTPFGVPIDLKAKMIDQQALWTAWPGLNGFSQYRGIRLMPTTSHHGLKPVFDWNEGQRQQLGDSIADSYQDPDGQGLGVGIWGGPISPNQLYNADFGKPKGSAPVHKFKEGHFWIVGRKRFLPTDYLDGEVEIDGQIHPTQEQLALWLDPTHDPRNYFSKEYTPNKHDIERGYCEIEETFEDDNWKFIILYSDGHDMYPEHHSGNNPFANGYSTISKSPFLKTNHQPDQPRLENISNATAAVSGTLNDSIELFSGGFSVDKSRSSNMFRGEIELGQDCVFPNHEGETFYIGDEYSMAWLNHYPNVNGHDFRNVHLVKWDRWGNGTAYAEASPNTSFADFRFNMEPLPKIESIWTNSFSNILMRDKVMNTPGIEDPQEIYDNLWTEYLDDDYINNMELETLQFLASQIGASGFHAAFTSMAAIYSQWLNYAFSSTYSMYTWEPETLLNGRPLQYYIRLDNLIHLTMDHINLPPNTMIRVIDMTNSGDYDGYTPTSNTDFSNAPVWWDFTEGGEGQSMPIHKTLIRKWFIFNNKLSITLPIDTTYEEDGPRLYKVVWGLWDPSAEVNENPIPCSDLGGGYGMPVINNSGDAWFNVGDPYSSGNTKSFGFTLWFQNTPPKFQMQPLSDMNLQNAPLEASYQTVSARVDTNGIPGHITISYLLPEHGEGNRYDDGVGEYTLIAAREVGVAGPCSRYSSPDTVCIGGVMDAAGNYSSDYKIWSYFSESDMTTDGEACANIASMTGNSAVLNLGDEYRLGSLIDDCGGFKWGGWGDGGGDAGTNHPTMFSCTQAIRKYLNEPNTPELNLILRGYASMEMIYNQWGWGLKHYLSQVESHDSNTNDFMHYELLSVARELGVVNEGGWRVKNFPTEADINAWDGTLVEPECNCSLPGTGGVKPFTDPWYEDLILKIDQPCIAGGKFGLSLPFIPLQPTPVEENGIGPTFGFMAYYLTWICPLPNTFNNAAYITGDVNNYCDVDPNFDFDSVEPGDTPADYIPPTPNDILFWYNASMRRWDFESKNETAVNGQGFPGYGDTFLTNPNKRTLSNFKSAKGSNYFVLDASGSLVTSDDWDGWDSVTENSEIVELEKGPYSGMEWNSKRFIMGQASQDKMFYKIRIAKDKKASANGQIVPIYIKIRTDKSGDEERYEEIVVDGNELITDIRVPRKLRKGKWIQFSIRTTEGTNTSISSISIIWRPKPIR